MVAAYYAATRAPTAGSETQCALFSHVRYEYGSRAGLAQGFSRYPLSVASKDSGSSRVTTLRMPAEGTRTACGSKSGWLDLWSHP